MLLLLSVTILHLSFKTILPESTNFPPRDIELSLFPKLNKPLSAYIVPVVPTLPIDKKSALTFCEVTVVPLIDD
jgi:hypothetical protein